MRQGTRIILEHHLLGSSWVGGWGGGWGNNVHSEFKEVVNLTWDGVGVGWYNRDAHIYIYMYTYTYIYIYYTQIDLYLTKNLNIDTAFQNDTLPIRQPVPWLDGHAAATVAHPTCCGRNVGNAGYKMQPGGVNPPDTWQRTSQHVSCCFDFISSL